MSLLNLKKLSRVIKYLFEKLQGDFYSLLACSSLPLMCIHADEACLPSCYTDSCSVMGAVVIWTLIAATITVCAYMTETVWCVCHGYLNFNSSYYSNLILARTRLDSYYCVLVCHFAYSFLELCMLSFSPLMCMQLVKNLSQNIFGKASHAVLSLDFWMQLLKKFYMLVEKGRVRVAVRGLRES